MADEKQDPMAYIARDKCGCIVGAATRDEHLEDKALIIAGVDTRRAEDRVCHR